MTESKYQPITDDEFTKQYHSLGHVENDLKQLVSDYKELDKKFLESYLHFNEGDFDWWGIKENQLKNILIYVYKELTAIRGEEEIFNILNGVDQNQRIQELWNKIHTQRQLNVENDPILKELYDAVMQEKINAGRL